MAARCTKHGFEDAAAACRSCGEPFCDECLVYTYGSAKPPFCVPCALVAAGVRRRSPAERRARRGHRSDAVEFAPAVGDEPADRSAAAKAAVGRSKIGLLVGALAVLGALVPVVSHLA